MDSPVPTPPNVTCPCAKVETRIRSKDMPLDISIICMGDFETVIFLPSNSRSIWFEQPPLVGSQLCPCRRNRLYKFVFDVSYSCSL